MVEVRLGTLTGWQVYEYLDYVSAVDIGAVDEDGNLTGEVAMNAFRTWFYRKKPCADPALTEPAKDRQI